MDPSLAELLEPAIVFATLLGTAFGVKLLIWGKGPIRRPKQSLENPALEDRIGEMESQWDQALELLRHQADRLGEVEERLDFTERMLTRRRGEDPSAIEPPRPRD